MRLFRHCIAGIYYNVICCFKFMLESTIHVYLFYVILSVVKNTPIYCFALGEKDEISREYNWYIPTIVFLLTISRW